MRITSTLCQKIPGQSMVNQGHLYALFSCFCCSQYGFLIPLYPLVLFLLLFPPLSFLPGRVYPLPQMRPQILPLPLLTAFQQLDAPRALLTRTLPSRCLPALTLPLTLDPSLSALLPTTASSTVSLSLFWVCQHLSCWSSHPQFLPALNPSSTLLPG